MSSVHLGRVCRRGRKKGSSASSRERKRIRRSGKRRSPGSTVRKNEAGPVYATGPAVTYAIKLSFGLFEPSAPYAKDSRRPK